jgi:hypothetical protein
MWCNSEPVETPLTTFAALFHNSPLYEHNATTMNLT